MASDPLPAADGERGLHPFSWLFVLLTQLRHGVLPLLLLLLFGQGDRWELMVLLGAAALALYSLVYSFGFRYRLDADELVLREGIIDRTERHVPYARVQNIVQQRNPLHRLFGVTELRLESAGGSTPEAVMSVITLAEAARIERILRQHVGSATTAADGSDEAAAGSVVLALGGGELLRLGLLGNRGWALVGAGLAGLWQFAPEERGFVRSLWHWLEVAIGSGAQWFTGPFALVLSALSFALVFVVSLKVLSVLMAVLGYYGFRLELHGERLRTSSGLLTRRVASARRDKIQRLILAETWLARRLGRCSLACEVAGGRAVYDDERVARLDWLAPIATRADAAHITARVAPELAMDDLDWQPLHPRAWRRMFKASAIVWIMPTLAIGIATGPWVVLPWAVLTLFSLLSARGTARFAAYAVDGQVIAWRSGWLSRRWTLARISKAQSVRLECSPFDRRAGMAAVAIDTAGAGLTAFRLRIPYLADSTARALCAHLAARLDTETPPADTAGVALAGPVSAS